MHTLGPVQENILVGLNRMSTSVLIHTRKNKMNYQEECNRLDKELAVLLGTPVFIDSMTDFMWYDGDNNYTQELRRWTQDDAQAFKLAVEYDSFPQIWKGHIWVGDGDDPEFSCIPLDQFPDKSSAARFNIVQLTIRKLKESK